MFWMRWPKEFWLEWILQSRHLWMVITCGSSKSDKRIDRLPLLSFLAACCLVGTSLVITSRVPKGRCVPTPTSVVRPKEPAPTSPTQSKIDYSRPVRKIPDRFPARTQMPATREGAASISIAKVSFDPDRDLMAVWDDRVWWESEHDIGDTENDHIVHLAMEEPLRRLIELVSREGGTLEVQDTYRETGIHAPKSLHKQGRAIDLTCDELGLERLAALTWAAGFDWVFYEAPQRGGHHVHASVRP